MNLHNWLVRFCTTKKILLDLGFFLYIYQEFDVCKKVDDRIQIQLSQIPQNFHSDCVWVYGQKLPFLHCSVCLILRKSDRVEEFCDQIQTLKTIRRIHSDILCSVLLFLFFNYLLTSICKWWNECLQILLTRVILLPSLD